MKLNGIVGKGSGKLGASVFAISGGEQIVRQYNPQVSNPNTDAQVAQRAKLKLMSQLAADLSRGIAIAKKGLVSARNQFVALNIGNATYAGNIASIDLDKIQLTAGSKAAPSFTAVRQTNGTTILCTTGANVPEEISAVVYVCAKAVEENRVQILGIKTDTRSAGGTFTPQSFVVTNEDVIVYAYGIIASGASRNSKYLDYEVSGSAESAELGVALSLLASGAATTMTEALAVAANE